MDRLRKYFFAGLIGILPLWMTYYIVLAVFNIVSTLAKPLLSYLPYLPEMPLLFNLASFVVSILIVLGFGIFIANVVGRRIFEWFEAKIVRLPFLSGIYSAIRKLTNLFSGEESMSKKFERVVVVEYPRKGLFSIGFVTQEHNPALNDRLKRDVLSVFVPTTPNPTSGLLILVPREEAVPLNISVDSAVKMIISGGIIAVEN